MEQVTANRPGQSRVAIPLNDYYMKNGIDTDNTDLPDVFWAWRNAFDPYIDYGLVKDNFDEEVTWKVLENFDKWPNELSTEQKASVRAYLAEELDSFPGIAGLAMMAAAYDLEKRLLNFMDSLNSTNGEVH